MEGDCSSPFEELLRKRPNVENKRNNCEKNKKDCEQAPDVKIISKNKFGAKLGAKCLGGKNILCQMASGIITGRLVSAFVLGLSCSSLTVILSRKHVLTVLNSLME